MRTTLTFRADHELRRALERRARSEGRTISDLVREILAEALSERPLGSRTAHLRGSLDLSEPNRDGWRKRLRERNWRP